MFNIKKDEKFIEVYPQKGGWGYGFDSYDNQWFIVPKSFKIPENKIIFLEPRISKDKKFGLKSVFVNREIDIPEDAYEPSVMMTYTDMDSKIKKAIRPSFICNIDLKPYVDNINKAARKDEIKKILDEALKDVEKLAKYKVLLELKPEFKSLVEELDILNDNKYSNYLLPDKVEETNLTSEDEK